MIGKISIQAVIAAIGAMLAQSELGANKKDKENEEKKKRKARYGGELFLMMVGAIFLAMNTAPTEEIILIGYKMSDAQIIFSHFFVDADARLRLQSRISRTGKTPSRKQFILEHFSALHGRRLRDSFADQFLSSVDIRTHRGLNLEDTLKIAVVMGFPGALGAAASRLIL